MTITLKAHEAKIIELQPEDVLRADLDHQSVRVLRGQAWITWEQSDIVLRTGESRDFDHGQHPAVITSLRGKPLTLEIVPAA